MAIKQYSYHGPINALLLPPPKEGESPIEKILHPGKVYDLPDDHKHVAVMVANRLLVECPVEATEKQDVPSKIATKAKGDANAS